MTKLIWHTEKRRVKDLKVSARNPNMNTETQFANLKKSIKRDGYVEIIVVDVDGAIVAGAHRYKALLEMGKGNEEIDVRVPNRKLTKAEFDRYLIASNALHGDWDIEKLKAFDVGTLIDIGMDEAELANLWDGTLETEDDDWDEAEEIAKIKKPKTKLGDVYTLGPNKIICGDATDPAVLKKLFGSEKASMIYSDPVYNLKGGVDYAKGVGGRANYGGAVKDTRTDIEYKTFLRKTIENALAVAKDDVHVFYWCDASYVWLLQTLYCELGISYKRTCLWIKNGLGLTPRIAFNKGYEPSVYGVRGKPPITKGIENLSEIMNKEIGTGNRTIDDILDGWEIWLAKRLPGNEYQHATSKPVTLHERAIRRCTKVNDIILDSFSGSGSTLLAGHQLKRRVYTIELEPLFCDLAIKRFEKSFPTIHARKLN
jgi:DNA modification methylase